MDEAKEISLQYIAEVKPITEYYIHDEPLPARAAGKVCAKSRKKVPKWLIVLIVILVLLGWGGTFVLHRLPVSFFCDDLPAIFENFTQIHQKRTVQMPLYEKHGDFRLCYTTKHGKALSAQEIYYSVNPSVVSILSSTAKGDYVGTGIILSDDGYILTNAHVLEDAKECVVILANGDAITSSLVGIDNAHDIAVVKIRAQGLPTVEFGDSDGLLVGDKAYAIGNPLGLELRGTMTDGIISAISRSMSVEGGRVSMLQTNAALNNGNSGGPLINEYGQIIGINTLKMGNLRSASATVEGLGFALPISEVAYIVNDLICTGEVQGEGLLGLSVYTEAVPMPGGRSAALYVSEVVSGGAADRAGICEGDYVLKANGELVTSSNDLLCQRRKFRIGEEIILQVWHQGQTRDVSVRLCA